VPGELAYARKCNPAAGERDLFVPGYSLRSTAPLEASLAANQPQWAALQPSLSHRNYDWTRGGDDRRAGWNLLHFGAPVVPGVEVWTTEYEASPGREKARLDRLAQAAHRNGVKAIRGFVFDVDDVGDDGNSKSKSKLSLLMQSAWHDGVLTMHDGMQIFAERERPEFAARFASKASPFKAVILECASLAHFCEVSGLAPIEGQPMVQIESPEPESWDILVVEPSAG
ncbi:MAG TPA: hypothetical protein VK439_13905, partial [Rubrivivax sp.]|nr:hypothetical protein [Rubrivivax sp.]